MRAIIAKEFRENGVWVVLMILAIGALMALAINKSTTIGVTLDNEAFHTVTALGFAAIGLALGLLQTIPDTGLGRWSFLIHRPLSPTRIFLAKLVAGVAMYGIAAGVPLGVLVLWFAAGGFGGEPFLWAMVLPRLADLAGGVVWYSAAWLVACRQGRWLASRLMPVGAAILVSGTMEYYARDFMQAIAISATGVVILLPAAWGAFVSGGGYEQQPAVTRFLQAISVGTGIAVALCLGGGLFCDIPVFLLGRAPINFPDFWTDIGSDGGVVNELNFPNGNFHIRDSQGREIPSTDSGLTYWTGLESQPDREISLQSPERYVVGLYWHQAAGHVIVHWSYIRGRRTIVGYTGGGEYYGGLGPSGFRPAGQPAEPFPDPLEIFPRMDSRERHPIVASRAAVYELDYDHEIVERVFAAGADGPILDGACSPYQPDTPDVPYFLAFATRSAVHILRDEKGILGNVINLPLEYGHPPFPIIWATQLNGGGFQLFYGDPFVPDGSQRHSWLVQFNDSGHATGHAELRDSSIPAANRIIEIGPGRVATILAAPPILGVSDYWTKQHTPNVTVTIFVSALIGAMSSLTALMLTSRYPRRRGGTLVWMLAGLLFGISGVLTMMSLRERVATVRCTNCGRGRVVRKEDCEHCHAPFAPPQRVGIEVFELV